MNAQEEGIIVGAPVDATEFIPRLDLGAPWIMPADAIVSESNPIEITQEAEDKTVNP